MTKSSRSLYRSNERHRAASRLIACTGAAWLVVACVAGSTTRVSAAADEHPRLPDGAGRDLMIKVCSQCHAPDVAADQQLDAAGWKTLVDEMASNGAAATDDEFKQIVDYLTKAFPAK
jgi:competence protein ComEA